jgi:DNA-binding response OmpR family regulator
MGTRSRVLIVEPDAATRSLLAAVLCDAGYAPAAVPDGPAGLERAEQEPPQLVLVNARLPGMDLEAFATQYRNGHGPRAPLIVLSTDPALPATLEADAVVPMPFNLDDLLAEVHRLAPQAPAPRGNGSAPLSKDEARRQQLLVRLRDSVAALRGALSANRNATRRLLGIERPLNRDELAQWRSLEREAERLRRELAQLYAEFEELRGARRGGR